MGTRCRRLQHPRQAPGWTPHLPPGPPRGGAKARVPAPHARRQHPTPAPPSQAPNAGAAEAVVPNGNGPRAASPRSGRAPWLGRARTRRMRPRRGNPPPGSARRAPSGYALAARRRPGRGDRRSRARASQGDPPGPTRIEQTLPHRPGGSDPRRRPEGRTPQPPEPIQRARERHEGLRALPPRPGPRAETSPRADHAASRPDPPPRRSKGTRPGTHAGSSGRLSRGVSG